MSKRNILPALLPIRIVLFFLTFFIGANITKQSLGDISFWWSIVASIVNILTVLILIYAAKKSGGTYWKLINYQKGKTKVKEIILVTLAILGIGMTGMYLAGFLCYKIIPYAAPMMIAPIPLWIAILNVFILPISTAFAEEGLYLGCGVNQIKGKAASILIPAFFFALQHSFIPTLFDLRYMLYRFLSFLPLTIILCWYYNKKRNPLPVMVGHATIDMATVIQILISSSVPGFYEQIINL